MNKEQIIIELLKEPFFVKTSKGNYLSCIRENGKWYAQGNEVKRTQDIEYLEKEYEKNKKEMEQQFDVILNNLEYGIWDSGNLSLTEQKILDYLLKQDIATRTPGIPGEHDTANGVARWIYTLKINENVEREQLHNRLTNSKRSKAAKLAWKRNHQSYMTGVRKRGRNMENKTFYSLAKELDSKVESKNESLNEESIIRDNVFDKQLDLSFDMISGGISFGIKDGTVSFSCSLKETGSGSYALEQGNEETLYKSIKQDLQNICKMVDDEMRQVIAKYGLKSTK